MAASYAIALIITSPETVPPSRGFVNVTTDGRRIMPGSQNALSVRQAITTNRINRGRAPCSDIPAQLPGVHQISLSRRIGQYQRTKD
jgi:hypothetical protein